MEKFLFQMPNVAMFHIWTAMHLFFQLQLDIMQSTIWLSQRPLFHFTWISVFCCYSSNSFFNSRLPPYSIYCSVINRSYIRNVTYMHDNISCARQTYQTHTLMYAIANFSLEFVTIMGCLKAIPQFPIDMCRTQMFKHTKHLD